MLLTTPSLLGGNSLVCCCTRVYFPLRLQIILNVWTKQEFQPCWFPCTPAVLPPLPLCPLVHGTCLACVYKQANSLYRAPAASINWLIGMLWEHEWAFPPQTLCHLFVMCLKAGKNKLKGASACVFFFPLPIGVWRDLGAGPFPFCVTSCRKMLPVHFKVCHCYSWQGSFFFFNGWVATERQQATILSLPSAFGWRLSCSGRLIWGKVVLQLAWFQAI